MQPCAGLGNCHCDSRMALLLLLLQQLQEFVDGFLRLLLIRSSIHCFFIVWVGGRLRQRWVYTPTHRITHRWSYYFGISHLILFNLGISRDMSGKVIKTGISQFK